MVWSLSVKLTVAVQEAVPAALVQLSPSVLTSTNASPTLSDAFPVTTVGPAGSLDHQAVSGDAAIDRIVLDGRAAVRGRSGPSQRDHAAPGRGREIPWHARNRRTCGRRRRSLI